MKMTRGCLLIIYLIFGWNVLYGQSARSSPAIRFEFIDQNIHDILYSFSIYAKISIAADDTVRGTASFQFNGVSFDRAFDSFLLANRLYVDKTPDVWIVTRALVIPDEEGNIKVDALDIAPVQLLEKISRKTGVTIVQDILPSTQMSLHLEMSSVPAAVEVIMKPFSEYTVEDQGAYIQVKKVSTERFAPGPLMVSGNINIQESGGIYEVSIENARIGDVLDRLFLTAKHEYTSFIRSDQIVDRVKFSGKIFGETLTMILEQGNGEFIELNNMWYIFPLQQTEIVRRLRDEGKAWRRFELKHLSSAEFQAFLQSRFPSLQMISMQNSSQFFSYIDDKTAVELQGYIRSLDIPRRGEPITLKYIRTEDLLKTLPPSVRRENIVDAGNGNTIFYLGTNEQYEVFRQDLAIIDRPQPRIRYDLFIMQIQDTSNLNWSFSIDARELQVGDKTMITGSLGNLFNLNFDIITIFGYQFAARINAAISENQASVFADTTLFGLSGQEIKFQNTSTYRYRDSNIDPDTGKPIYSGVTREIVSGLVLEIKGWVSGDGMITTNVTASVSKRGADVSSNIGNPPPTSEKVLTTQVRSRSGEPVVLSGLKQNDETIVEERVPFMSKIPLLGWLFRGRNSTNEKTQMIIYLVPHLDLSSDEYTQEGKKTEILYNRFVAPFLEGRK